MENVERTASDNRVTSTSLSDKLTEANREVVRLRTKLAETAASLKQEQQLSQELQQSQQLLVEELEQCRTENAGMKSQLAAIQAELAYVKSSAQENHDAARALEDYKKRAQAALKKVL